MTRHDVRPGAWWLPGNWTWRFWISVPVMVERAGRDLRLERRLRSFVYGAMVGVGLLIVSLIVCAAPAVQAELTPQEDANVEVTKKTVTGKLDLVTARMINIIYDVDKEQGVEYEIGLPYDEHLELGSKKSLDELHRGDTVRVTYEETSWVDENDFERQSRHAIEIRLIRSRIKGGMRSDG